MVRLRISSVAARRMEEGLTQREMADKVGMKYDNYVKKEHGTTRWNDEEKLRIAKVFGLSLKEFDDMFYSGRLSALEG